MTRLASLLLVLCATGSLSAQAASPVGSLLVAWPNPVGVGSPVLDAMVHYPAMATGYAAPVRPRAGGYPVVVFLHGYDKIGLDYNELGIGWAAAGFAVVMLNTARVDLTLLSLDAQAMPAAISAANVEPTSPLAGMFATLRIGLAGHSMGGAACAMAQAGSAVYRACLALSPVDVGLAGPYAGQVTVPFGIVVGQGDFVTSLQAHALPYFNSLGTADGLKFIYLMNQDCSHSNIAGLDQVPSAEVFPRVIDLGIGFFRHFLGEDPLAMDRCIGDVAQAEPRMVSITQRVAEPQIWISDPLRIGDRTRISVACEPGFGGVLVALDRGPGLSTPFGTLLLDPASTSLLSVGIASAGSRVDTMLQVPADPDLIGFSVSFQALGDLVTSPVAFGSAITLEVGS
jgi:hypothetical protein